MYSHGRFSTSLIFAKSLAHPTFLIVSSIQIVSLLPSRRKMDSIFNIHWGSLMVGKISNRIPTLQGSSLALIYIPDILTLNTVEGKTKMKFNYTSSSSSPTCADNMEFPDCLSVCLSVYPSLSSIALGRSSKLHPVSAQKDPNTLHLQERLMYTIYISTADARPYPRHESTIRGHLTKCQFSYCSIHRKFMKSNFLLVVLKDVWWLYIGNIVVWHYRSLAMSETTSLLFNMW